MTSTNSTSVNGSGDQAAGTKHEIDKTSPVSKRAKKEENNEKDQKTIEESMPGFNDATKTEEAPQDKEYIKTEPKIKAKESSDGENGLKTAPKFKTKESDEKSIVKTEPKIKTKESVEGKDPKAEPTIAVDTQGRGGSPPGMLEKGMIYFFFRGRVGIDEPSSVDDVARSYVLLRPIPLESKLRDGPIGDAGNSRLIAIPKKVFPLSGRDRWIALVEKTNASYDNLKKEFLSATDYETKTAGTRHSPAATPIGEGIYAITTTGRENHLAYILTLPSELGEVQQEFGIREKGTFVISTKNPDYESPTNAQFPEGPKYTQDVKDEFRSLRWMPTQPKHLNFVNTQFLLIGESGGIEKVSEFQKKNKGSGQAEPLEEMERLEEEDAQRVEGLKIDDAAAIFADLEASREGLPDM